LKSCKSEKSFIILHNLTLAQILLLVNCSNGDTDPVTG